MPIKNTSDKTGAFHSIKKLNQPRFVITSQSRLVKWKEMQSRDTHSQSLNQV